MPEADVENCCRGNRVATEHGEFTQESVREACRNGIREAIESQLEGDRQEPVVIDGLPTIGKTHQATRVAAEFDEPVAILTHRYDTRDDHIAHADKFDERVEEIPTLDRHCPTAKGENGKDWAEMIHDYRDRGASPTYLHYHLLEELPCMQQDEDCPYITQWDVVESTPVVVGGPVHAALERVVDDRIVIFDEDPGQAYRREFDADQLSSYVSTFLGERDALPVDNFQQLQAISNNDSFAEQQAEIREYISDSDSVAQQSEALNEGGHVEASTATLALLELEGPTIGQEQSGPQWEEDLRTRAELDFTELPDGAQVVHDHKESQFVIRRPPDLQGARAVIGLDGTPVERLWRGRLGVDKVDCRRILCDDCRARYLTEVVGYTFVQTTSFVKPYSSGNHVNPRADYGLIEAVAAKHDSAPGVITSRSAEERLFEEGPNELLIDPQQVKKQIGESKHYGNLRSSNEFEGTRVGIVLGSPHPGDRPIQITAALEGDIAVRDEDTKGTDLDYGIPDRPYLRHYREHKVAQAALRFGRTSPATVYLHTGALPEWLEQMVSAGPEETNIDERSDGEMTLIRSLENDGSGTAREIADREDVTIGEKHARDCLKGLRDEGVVARDDTQPYTWSADGIDDAPYTAHVVLPDVDE